MVRVLQVIGGMDRGGAETFLMTVFRNINKEQVQFDFLVYYERKGAYDDEIIALGGRIIHIPAPKTVGYNQTVDNIRRVIRENGPYVAVHAHTLFNSGLALWAAKKEKVNIRVAHSHTTTFSNRTYKLIRWLYIFTMRFMITRCATQNVACSPEAARFLFGVDTKKQITIMTNRIDAKAFTSRDEMAIRHLLQELGLSLSIKVITSVARLEKVKNHTFMIGIADALKRESDDFVMLFIGDGSLRDELQQAVRTCGLERHVLFLGVRQDIASILQISQFFIMPSLYEGLPVSLVEAQAAGVHCLISDVISCQVDFGLNLVTYLPNDHVCVWAECIQRGINPHSIPSPEKRLEIIRQKGYDIKMQINDIYTLYSVESK